MSNSEDDRVAPDSDQPPAELEPGEVIEAELGRLARHPRAEIAHLKQVAEDGEQGSTPFIEIALIVRWIVPLVAVFIGVVLLIYYKA